MKMSNINNNFQGSPQNQVEKETKIYSRCCETLLFPLFEFQTLLQHFDNKTSSKINFMNVASSPLHTNESVIMLMGFFMAFLSLLQMPDCWCV